MSILVVDDCRLNRVYLRRLALSAGAADVQEACDGQQAVLKYTASSGPSTFRLILMDCRMPVMDGWQATEHIRQLEAAAGWAPIPIIAVTTEDLSPGSPALQRCWECGMSAATGKQMSREYLVQLLHQCAPNRHGADSGTGSGRSSPRSSMDSESSCLPDRLQRVLCSSSFFS